MKAEEYLLRFLALNYRVEQYQKPLEAFLNDFVEYHRNDPNAVLDGFEAIFERTISVVEALYGDLAFAIYDVEANKQVVSAFNAALFDAEMVSVGRSKLSVADVTVSKKDRFQSALGQLFYDEHFRNAIGRATSDVAQVKHRVHALEQLMKKHL